MLLEKLLLRLGDLEIQIIKSRIKIKVMIAPITAALLSLFQSKKNRRETKRELSTQDKKELKKIDEMGLFEAMDYLAKKDTGAGFQGEDKGDGLSGFRG